MPQPQPRSRAVRTRVRGVRPARVRPAPPTPRTWSGARARPVTSSPRSEATHQRTSPASSTASWGRRSTRARTHPAPSGSPTRPMAAAPAAVVRGRAASRAVAGTGSPSMNKAVRTAAGEGVGPAVRAARTARRAGRRISRRRAASAASPRRAATASTPQPESARSARRLAARSGVAAGGGKEDDSEADRALAGLMGPTVTRDAAHIWRPAARKGAGVPGVPRKLTGALSPGLNEDRMPSCLTMPMGQVSRTGAQPRAQGVLASHDPGTDRPGPLGVVHPDAGTGSPARTRSGGAGRVLHEGGALLEEGRVYFG